MLPFMRCWIVNCGVSLRCRTSGSADRISRRVVRVCACSCMRGHALFVFFQCWSKRRPARMFADMCAPRTSMCRIPALCRCSRCECDRGPAAAAAAAAAAVPVGVPCAAGAQERPRHPPQPRRQVQSAQGHLSCHPRPHRRRREPYYQKVIKGMRCAAAGNKWASACCG